MKTYEIQPEINWLPRLQCHRGYWVEGLPQNTLSSIKEAHRRGYEMCEFDVRLTYDNVVILYHDSKFQERKISEMNVSELKSHLEITTLEELFSWFSKIENFKLNIEIKSSTYSSIVLEKTVAELILKYRIEDRVLISSFNFLSLSKMRFLCPGVKRAFLLTFEKVSIDKFKKCFWIVKLLCRPDMLNLRFQDFDNYFQSLSKKYSIVLWTVNDIDIFKKHKNYISGVISDKILPENIKGV